MIYYSRLRAIRHTSATDPIACNHLIIDVFLFGPNEDQPCSIVSGALGVVLNSVLYM